MNNKLGSVPHYLQERCAIAAEEQHDLASTEVKLQTRNPSEGKKDAFEHRRSKVKGAANNQQVVELCADHMDLSRKLAPKTPHQGRHC